LGGNDFERRRTKNKQNNGGKIEFFVLGVFFVSDGDWASISQSKIRKIKNTSLLRNSIAKLSIFTFRYNQLSRFISLCSGGDVAICVN
jgi:hypothetical protein